MAVKEFLFSIYEYLEEVKTTRILNSPFYSLMRDEITDCSLEKYLMVYAILLGSQKLGPPISRFLKLIIVSYGRGKTTYDAVNHLKEEMGLSK